ncbi:CpGbinding proteinlike [Caligus rogercresseyi]|uniref:CpGbinding proteinlike n=1 Tax=Caligus rogercresseyi TaxID=217165 RepID=A0A7T8GYQ4_CALRO|nr:CpGbinding proteinlike [Caligus rogercresseyi]
MVQQGKEDSPKKVSEPGAASSKSKACETPPLPSREEVRLFTQGRAPFHCLSCDKRLSKSSLRSHLKNKHPGVVSSLAFTCLICSESLSSLGAINTHSHAELYPCFKCEAKKSKDPPAFPDFERLKSHLFNAHNRTLWPWTCSVCEAVSFFELDHILHARCHSPKEAIT